MTENWEDVPIPKGAFMSWGEMPGQIVEGRVIDVDMAGGTDFGGAVCPQLTVELRQPTYAINKLGERYDFAAGEMLTVNAGLANLKKGIRAASPDAGDLIKIEFAKTERSGNGTVKVFAIKIARNPMPNRPHRGPATVTAQSAPPF